MARGDRRDEAALLEGWRAGDNAAGSELFDRHFDSLRRFFACKISAGIDDLVQQTFLACVSRRDAIQPGGLRAYLFAVARSKLYDELRRRSRDDDFSGESSSLADLGITPSQAVADQQELQLVVQALRRLPIDLQIALELYYFEGLRGPELAVALGIAVGTVRSRVRRGLELLRRGLEQLTASPELRRDTASTLATWAEQVNLDVGDE